MYEYVTRWLCAIALILTAGTAHAVFHLWTLSEVYSNADGTVQFVELRTSAGGQQFLADHSITSAQGATMRVFTFPSDLPGDTAGRTFLIGTTGFAALGLVTPDYIVPNGFLFTTNGSVNFAGVDSISWTALPVDGVMSIDRSGAVVINSPTNFAGATASVAASSAGPTSASSAQLGTIGSRAFVDANYAMYGSFTIVNATRLYIAVRGPSLKTLGVTQSPLDFPLLRIYDSAGKDIVTTSGVAGTSGCNAASSVALFYANVRSQPLDVRDTCALFTSLAAGVYTFSIGPSPTSTAKSGEIVFEVTFNTP